VTAPNDRIRAAALLALSACDAAGVTVALLDISNHRDGEVNIYGHPRITARQAKQILHVAGTDPATHRGRASHTGETDVLDGRTPDGLRLLVSCEPHLDREKALDALAELSGRQVTEDDRNSLVDAYQRALAGMPGPADLARLATAAQTLGLGA